MPVAIAVTNVNNTTLRASFSITGLETTKTYDIVRVIETSDDNERRYQLVGSYQNWKPTATTLALTDTEAPLRPYRLKVWDSSAMTPLDFDFATGGYTGPAALAQSTVVTLVAPLCGAILRSTKVPGLYAEVRIHDFSPILYRARVSELTPMGTRYPVIIADRREGRRVESLVIYAPNNVEGKALNDLLLPENGRIYPVWVRTGDDNKLLFHDMLMMPLDITVEPASKTNPTRRFFTVQGVEIDPRQRGGVV